MNEQVLIPSARRLMTSLRGLPYDLAGAVADLVDNSIDADATHVRVDLIADWRGACIRIADDGTGMTEGELDEAMRYGSARSYDLRDLGHYGLGLKTASLSQCRRLTVATRSTMRGRVRIRRWDLDRVAAQDTWVLERPQIGDCRPELVEPLADGTGTVVLWEELDRVLGVLRPETEAVRRRLHVASQEISAHLSMAFHRFLSDEAPGSCLGISVNDQALEPWDPFARGEPLTQRLPPQSLRVEHDGSAHRVRVQPFILPNQHHFSSPQAHEEAAGPKRWNRSQGLYIYRRDRLIQGGGWNRLRTLDEHTKLARISLDIPPEADAAFRTDVAKMRVGVPDDLRPQLRALIAGVVVRAQETYRQRMRLVPAEDHRLADDHSGFLLGDHWPMVSSVLARELADHPDLLDRVLLALINATPDRSEEVIGVGTITAIRADG